MGLFGKWSRRDLLKSSGAVAGAAAVPLAVSSGSAEAAVQMPSLNGTGAGQYLQPHRRRP